MSPSETFLLITVRMLQAVRRQAALDGSILKLMDEGQVQFMTSAQEAAHYRGELAKAVTEHQELAARFERELPTSRLTGLLASVTPGSRDAEAIEAELRYRAEQGEAPDPGPLIGRDARGD